MDGDETYILLLLSDSNLPTGSFVASAGLESYAIHGFLAPEDKPRDNLAAMTDFVQDSLSTYARSALPFVSDAHRIVQESVAGLTEHGTSAGVVEDILKDLQALDEIYDTMTLNHVARRASKSQGVALLTLHSKGFSKPPPSNVPSMSRRNSAETEDPQSRIDAHISSIVDRLKLAIRREDTHGHLPLCWGVLTAALGLSLERSQYLHLFLHARSLLSAAVRMNTLGPYAAQQLLLHVVRPLVDLETTRCKDLRTGLRNYSESTEECKRFDDEILTKDGPAMTWPLGEILASRHDLQHSRIFNS